MQISKFFADSKSRAQELSNDVSFVIFGHKTWDLEGAGSNWTPPKHILVFKYPSWDRVKLTFFILKETDFFVPNSNFRIPLSLQPYALTII